VYLLISASASASVVSSASAYLIDWLWSSFNNAPVTTPSHSSHIIITAAASAPRCVCHSVCLPYCIKAAEQIKLLPPVSPAC